MAADVREDETNVDQSQYEVAAAEWSNVAEVTLARTSRGAEAEHGEAAPAECPVSPLVSVADITEHLRTQPDMDTFLAQVKTQQQNTGRYDRGLRRLLCCFSRPKPLLPHLRQTVRMIQATSLIPFSNEDPLHLAMLRTIYRQLTSTRVDCPRYGEHWEAIGFQGTDPSTDLRGVGVLGLVTATYLAVTPELLPFTRDLYALSRTQDQGTEFPLMVLSLNITRIALHVLRDGLLNKHVALEEDVWATFNFYYACLLYHVYHTWRSQRLSIRDCGPLLQQTETLARSKVGNLIAQFEKFLSSNYSVAAKQAAREQISKHSRHCSTTAGVVQLSAAE